MGWVIFAIICIILLLIILYLLYLSSRRRSKKSAYIGSTIVPPQKEPSKVLEKTIVEETGDELHKHGGLLIAEDLSVKHKRDAKKNKNKEAIPYENIGKESKHPASIDWQKYSEDSILSPFPESSLALSYLHEAQRLEKERANPKEIKQVLDKASEIDPDAVDLYLGRMEIIRRRSQNRRH